ncbi:MFS transporter [Amnibacterium setariae]|uniref:MFS transporter n=1 Tax=Amnibacterium setariae TaxID=2306585 RepID=A0A3A1TYJ4_9MICO|nr:MFS transporter [Amnibacterium setariae]RIX28658.1 MFS transporter [Amnibacterium setariae]
MTTTNPPVPVTAPHTAARAWTAVVMLAVALFAFVSTELMPIGLLPQIAHGTGVSVGTAGFLVTGFAFIVGVLASPMTALTSRMDRRLLVVVLLAACAAGNLIAGLAPNYVVLLAGRALIALAIGVFWSIGAATAVRIVSSEHGVRATSLVLSGLSLASVLGVPLGTALGEHTSWRFTFAALGALSTVALLIGLLVIPSVPASKPTTTGRQQPVWKLPALRVAVAVTGLAMIGNFLAFTYITPFLTDVTGVPGGSVGLVLVIWGAAGLVGNFAIAPLLNRSLRRTLLITVALLAAALVGLSAFGASFPLVAVALVLWGAAYAALPVVLQTWVFRVSVASGQADAATSMYVSAYNLAIGLGALVGGLVIAGPGAGAVVLIGGIVTATALLVLLPTSRHQPDTDH